METRQGGDLSLEKPVTPVAASGRIPTDALRRGDRQEEEPDSLSMSFLQHLEEMRTRIIRALMGLVVTFMFCIAFCYQLWDFVQAPATDALKKLGADPPVLIINQPMEFFSIVWVQIPMVFSLFLASPWVLYQFWRSFHRVYIGGKKDWRFRLFSVQPVCSFSVGYSLTSSHSDLA